MKIDSLVRATAAYSAATSATDPQVRNHYLAIARGAIREATDQLRQLTEAFAGFEAEVVRLGKSTPTGER